MFRTQSKERCWNHLFGPVASRRLGFSLGVDIIPPKTCTFDCIYCEVGRTTTRTTRLVSYIPPDEILAEVDDYFSGAETVPDYVTITGSGEPTLHRDLQRIVEEIKKMTRLPLAVLTNGSLLHREPVREALRQADLVAPSLDAARETAFQAVNRPHPLLRLDRIVEGLEAFRKTFRNRIWLEILLVKNVNDAPQDRDALKQALARIQPDRVQLNTVVRPPAEAGVRPVDAAELESWREHLGARCEIIASFQRRQERKAPCSTEEDIVRMLRRRPCDLQEISTALGIPPARLEPTLNRLLEKGRVLQRRHGGTAFFQTV